MPLLSRHHEVLRFFRFFRFSNSSLCVRLFVLSARHLWYVFVYRASLQINLSYLSNLKYGNHILHSPDVSPEVQTELGNDALRVFGTCCMEQL